jgi:hypothetical protein
MAEIFDQIFLPLRFGVLALFDKRKVSILDPKLLEMLKALLHPTNGKMEYFKESELINFVDDRKVALDMMLKRTDISASKSYKLTLQEVLMDILKSHTLKEKRKNSA